MIRPTLPALFPTSCMIVAGDTDDVEDDEDGLEAQMTLYGCTSVGNSICIHVKNVKPWFRLELPTSHDIWKSRLQSFFERQKVQPHIELCNLSRFYGWQEGIQTTTREYRYATIYCDSFKQCNKLQSMFKNRVSMEGFTGFLPLVDHIQKHSTKFMNDKQWNWSSWIQFDTFDISRRESNCQLECSVDYNNIKAIENDSIAPLVILSFDAEMYSNDGLFPDPQKGDFTTHIGLSCQIVGSPTLYRWVICLGDATLANPDIQLVCVQSRHEMMEMFQTLLVDIDPDIITGWNVYGFDFSFLHAEYETFFTPLKHRGYEHHHEVEHSTSTLLHMYREKCGRDGRFKVRQFLKDLEHTVPMELLMSLAKAEREFKKTETNL